jgi:hypothetical protein
MALITQVRSFKDSKSYDIQHIAGNKVIAIAHFSKGGFYGDYVQIACFGYGVRRDIRI